MPPDDICAPHGSAGWFGTRCECAFRVYSHGAMTGANTIAGQIERLIVRLDGASVCDACVTERLNLSVPSQANVVTRALGGQRGFERRKDHCTLCGTTKTVIRHTGKQA